MRSPVIALVCWLLWCWPAFAQTYQPLINPHEQFLDVNGKPLANGKIFSYVAGTSSKAATYKDSSGTTSNSNPIITDSAGFATIYLDVSKSYKIVLQNAQGVQQWTADNVTGGVPTGGGGGMIYPAAGIANSTGTAWGTSYNAANTIPASFVSGLAAAYIDWNAASGGASILNKPTIPTSASWPNAGACTVNQYVNALANGSAPTCSQVLYSQLGGTVPTWNQNTTGTAAGITGNGTANQVWGMNSGGTAQGWQTPTGGGGLADPGANGIIKRTALNTTAIAVVADYPTLNQNTTGSAAKIAGGTLGSIVYQSAASTTAFLAGNTAATDTVLVSHGTGAAAAAPTLNNAPVLSAANMTSFPTLNQNTTGTAANITGTSNATLTTLSALSLPYGQLSGTVPTWNQSTTGNAATATALATAPTQCSAGNYPLGVDTGGNAQNCTAAGGGAGPVYSTTSTGTLTTGTGVMTGFPVLMVTPSANTNYRFEFQVKQTNTPAGCTTAGSVQVKITFTDGDDSVAVNMASGMVAESGIGGVLATTLAFNTSAPTPTNTWYSPSFIFNAKSGAAVSLLVQQTVASVACTTFPTFTIRPALYATGY